MKVHSINNNYSNPNFGAKYIVKGNKDEVRQVFEMAKKHIDILGDGNLMLHYNTDTILICTDEANKNAISNIKKVMDVWTQYPKFLNCPLDSQLQKIFKDGAKEVKRYDASEILRNPNFNFIEGV